MIKKLSVLGLCALGLILPAWSQEEPAIVEQVAFATAWSWPLFEYWPTDPTTSSYFKSPVLISFDVPASPKSPAMFLEVWGQFLYTWTNHTNRIRSLSMGFKFTSPAFPTIEIRQGFGIPESVFETNYAEDHMYPTNDAISRVKGYTKLPLRRTIKGIWNVYDTSIGRYLFEAEAIPIIEGFIDGGYKVEVWAEGTVEGLSYVAPVYWQVEVTRLSKKK